MLIDATNQDHVNYKVFDSAGSMVPGVVSYDTKTKEVELVIRLYKKKVTDENGSEIEVVEVLRGEDKKPLTVRFILPGSYAKDLDDNLVE